MRNDGLPYNFDAETIPWLDRMWREIDDYVDALELAPDDPEQLRRDLIHWARYGFVAIRNAIEHDLIDAYLADIQELCRDFKKHNVLVGSDNGYHPIREFPEEDVRALAADRDRIHMRITDFHCYSVAAKKLSVHRRITEFLSHVFRDRLVVLQSLTFMRGTEQSQHADYAYVPAHIPSQLAASWIALEDIHADAGPLQYIPGSHTGRKFQWGDGIFRTNSSTATDDEFSAYLEEQGRLNGTGKESIWPKKGDVFIWHGALSHGGSPIANPEITRKSYVTHYSQASTHFWEHRNRGVTTERTELNGHFFHVSPIDPTNEDVFRNGDF